MPASSTSSYEEIPYEGFALFLTHPNHLAAAARVFGVVAPEVETCRVLELGCARGDNLIPMAYSLPNARFVGVDLAPGQIEEGRATIKELGLTNIELHARDILELGAEFGPFDYIVAHGVYSWVPEAVREKMLRFYAEALAPDGIGHISYNTYPGWHMRSMVRDMMMFRSRGIEGTRERVRAGQELMQGLAQLLANHEPPYARCLREAAEVVARHEECYIAHEYMDEWNDPVYLHEFVERATAHGLKYLTESEYWTTAAPHTAELLAPFGEFAEGWVEREQLLDYIKGRAFRHAVLCHEGLASSRAASAGALLSLRMTSLVKPATANPVISADGGEEFHKLNGGVALTTNDPGIRAALRILDDARPGSVSFEALWAEVKERAAAFASGVVETDAEPLTAEGLAERLLDAYGHNLIELHVVEPEIAKELGEFPVASPIARRAAAVSARVANLRHRMIGLIDFEPLILAHLDGRHDRRALVGIMLDAVKAGTFTLQADGKPVADQADAEAILSQLLEHSLQRLTRSALLIG